MPAGGTGPARVLADLYERWTLDIIPCLGQPCAALCRDYPQKFKKVPGAQLVILANLLYSTGYDSSHLDEQQRKALLMPVLGDSDGAKGRQRAGAFHGPAEALRSRAKDFVQRVFDTGEAQLREAFRDAATTFQKYLTTVEGNVADDAIKRLDQHFNDVIAILQEPEFARGLGLTEAAAAPWPLKRSWDGNGAMLVQAITNHAQAAGGKPMVTDGEFLQIQRIATYGAETINAVMTDAAIWTTKSNADNAISSAYRWWTAMAELTGTLGVSIR